MGITGLINEAQAFEYIDGFEGSVEEEAIELFDFAGTEFFGHARLNKKFEDHTSNLKNSISYSVVVKGKEIREKLGDDASSECIKQTKAGVRPLLKQVKGIGLIGLAGMEYGMYVEDMKGKSVLAQSIPFTEKLLNRLFDEL